MSSGERTRRDVATTKTSPHALPHLQEEVASALTRAKKRNPGGDMHVGLVGPGEILPGWTRPPQVEETLRTMQSQRVSGVLHVYDYHPRGVDAWRAMKHQDEVIDDPKTRTNIAVAHHFFDLTNPDPNERSKSDVVIATRAVAPVLAAQKRDPVGLAARKRIVEALRDKAKPDADILTDRPVAERMRADYRDVFGDRHAQYRKTGTGVRDVGTFSFAPRPAAVRLGSPSPAKTPAAATPRVAMTARERPKVQATPPPESALARRLAYAASLKAPTRPK